MEQYLRDYLTHVGVKGTYNSTTIPCEICSSTQCTVIRDVVSIGKGAFGKLPVVACDRCGFLFQNPRFNQQFYQDYYSQCYRNVTAGQADPTQQFIDDQIKRGETLYSNLSKFLPKTGSMLDVGSSVGGMMVAFIKNGWSALGTDPDSAFVRYGKEKLKLPVEDVGAEDMQLKSNCYDFIMIMGSLEHVFDPNTVLKKCRVAAKEGSILLLEGRGHPQSHTKTYFNHNHHRYFSLSSIELMMIKHGWEPIWTTDEPICGPTRPGGIYCVGKASNIPSHDDFLRIIDSGKREAVSELLTKYNKIDEKFNAKL